MELHQSAQPRPSSCLPNFILRCCGWDEGKPLSNNNHLSKYSDLGNGDELVELDSRNPSASGDETVSSESDRETCMWNCLRSKQIRGLLTDPDQQDSDLLCGIGEKLRWAGSTFCSAVKFVAKNEAETPLGWALCSLVNITARQTLISVFWETTSRQVFARLFGQLAENHPAYGWVMGVMPTVIVMTLNLWGHFRDLRSGAEVDEIMKKFSVDLKTIVSGACKDVADEELDDFCGKLVRQLTDQLENHDPIQAAIYARSDFMQFMIVSAGSSVQQSEEEDADPDGIRLDSPPQQLVESPRDQLKKKDPGAVTAVEDLIKRLQCDVKNKTWPTRTVTGLRVLSTLLIGIESAVAAEHGITPLIGPTLLAYAKYCAEREIAQLFFPCPDGLHKYYGAATGIAAVSYIPNQFLVGFAMTTLAGRSGQSAVGLTFLEALRNDVIRGCFNSLGEIVDLIILVLAQSKQNHEPHSKEKSLPFRVELGFVKVTNYEELMEAMTKLQNTFTALGAARMGIFQETVLFSSLFFNFVQIDESVGEYGTKAIVALVEAIYLGCRYSDLIARGGRVNWPYDSKLQTTSAAPR